MKFFLSETTKLQIEKVKLRIVDDVDGDNYNNNRYKFGLKVCHEDKCCEFDFKDFENGRPGLPTIYPKKFTNSTTEMDASSINSQNGNSCQRLDLNAGSLLKVSRPF